MGAADIIGLSFLGAGAVLLLITVLIVKRIRRFLATAVEVPGTVLGHEERRFRSSTGGMTVAYHPIITFTTVTGRQMQYTDNAGSKPPSHAVGQSVPVRYDPADETDARIGTTGSTWLAPIITGSIGVALAVPGAVVLVVA